GLDRLVAQTVALVLVVPLDLGLDVGHSSHLRVMCQRSTPGFLRGPADLRSHVSRPLGHAIRGPVDTDGPLYQRPCHRPKCSTGQRQPYSARRRSATRSTVPRGQIAPSRPMPSSGTSSTRSSRTQLGRPAESHGPLPSPSQPLSSSRFSWEDSWSPRRRSPSRPTTRTGRSLPRP